MQFLDGTPDAAARAVSAFIRDHGADLAPLTYDALAGYASIVDRVCYGAEALYAVAADLPSDGQILCAQLAQVAIGNGWHEIGQTDRGPKVVLAMRRRLGELTDGEAPPADDPEPLAQFIPE